MTTPSNTQIEGLIERVKAATGPDMLLSNDIWRAVRGQEPGSILYHETPDVTDSIDAALALAERVLPGWQVNVSTYGPFAEASVGAMDAFNRFRAPTAPLAILAAILATLIAIQSSETK